MVFRLSEPAAENVTLRYELGGTAVNGEDYESLTGMVLIPAGQEEQSLAILPRDDHREEGDETVEVTLLRDHPTVEAVNYEYVLDTETDLSVNVTINDDGAGNSAPVISQGSAITVWMSSDGNPTPFDLTLRAPDPDGDQPSWQLVTPAVYGTVEASSNKITLKPSYMPSPGWSGTDAFTVEATDDLGASARIDVTVVVVPSDFPAPGSTTLEKRSPYSRAETICETMNCGTVPQDYDLSAETFLVRYPIGFDPTKPTPVVISMPSLGKPCLISEALDEFGLLCVGIRYHEARDEPVAHTIGFALDAAHFVQTHFNVDPDRFYLHGSGHGGRRAQYLHHLHPEIFRGGFIEYYGGKWGDETVPKPEGEMLELAQNGSGFVLYTDMYEGDGPALHSTANMYAGAGLPLAFLQRPYSNNKPPRDADVRRGMMRLELTHLSPEEIRAGLDPHGHERTADRPCPGCGGDGILNWVKCHACDGTGFNGVRLCRACMGQHYIPYVAPKAGSNTVTRNGKHYPVCPLCAGKGTYRTFL